MAFDFQHAVSAPFRMQPGLRRLAPGAAQLTHNHPGARHLHEKLAALTATPERVLLQQPGFEPATALAALEAHALGEHPDALRRDDQGRLHADLLGCSVGLQGDVLPAGDAAAPGLGACLSALPPPQRRAALLALAFAEDFAIVDGERATIPWLAVALPSHWSPAQKVGRHFAEVHAPVADNRLLLTAGEHLMRLVTGDERWERFVWNVTRHPRLNHHPDVLDPAPWPPALEADGIAAMAFFRTERQTFIPVPGAGQAVFTILVDNRPLAEAITTPDQAARLHEAIATMSPAVQAYRSLADVRERLLDWLARRAAGRA